jgi:S1-C subfamily serine protease
MKIRKAHRTTMPFTDGLSGLTDKSKQVPQYGGGTLDKGRAEFDANSGGDHKFTQPEPDDASHAVGGLFLGEFEPGGDIDIPYETEVVVVDMKGKEHVDTEHDFNTVVEMWSGKPTRAIFRRKRQMMDKAASSGNKSDLVPVIADILSACFKMECESPKFGKKEIGSCFAVSQDTFVTCAHVISRRREDPSSVSCFVVESDKRHRAIPITVDYDLDIAVFKCLTMKHTYLEMKGISSMSAGAEILAVGSPYGYDNNVSKGMISSIKRNVDEKGAVSYFFVDLAIYPGSSGGPIVDVTDRNVVGVAAMIVQPVGNYGLNAAIPSEYVTRILSKGK